MNVENGLLAIVILGTIFWLAARGRLDKTLKAAIYG